MRVLTDTELDVVSAGYNSRSTTVIRFGDTNIALNAAKIKAVNVFGIQAIVVTQTATAGVAFDLAE